MGENQIHSERVCTRFHAAIELIGRRWTGAIIFFALFEILKYEEFRNYPSPPGILNVWQTTSDDLSLSDSQAQYRRVTSTTISMTTSSSRKRPHDA